MSQHTPGPWRVDDEIFVIGPDKLSIFGGASTKRSEEVCKANARLIAVAPEMLEALEAIIYASDQCQGHRSCNHSLEPWHRARALLAKVKGQPVEGCHHSPTHTEINECSDRVSFPRDREPAGNSDTF